MPAPEHFTVHAYPSALRALGAALKVGALGCLSYLGTQFLLQTLDGEQRLQPMPMLLLLALGVLLPLGLGAGLRWWTRATVETGADGLALTLRDGARLEVPYPAVASVRPWWLPLPGPGLTLHMATGRRFGYGLEAEDAVPLLEALGRRGPLGAAATHPLVRFAQARHALWRRRWYHLAFKFAVFTLLPAGVLFRLHQFIVYGGTFGEYQMYGLERYVRSFLLGHYLPVALGSLLAACIYRVLAEPVAFAAAWLMPSRARGVRRGAEWLGRLVYYGLLPGLIVVRILS
ncbi:MAG TPA: hypothetical protein VE153_10135 [Myxococcus sp.]|nr:hypothetical protein [Myxococcus sp.]